VKTHPGVAASSAVTVACGPVTLCARVQSAAARRSAAAAPARSSIRARWDRLCLGNRDSESASRENNFPPQGSKQGATAEQFGILQVLAARPVATATSSVGRKTHNVAILLPIALDVAGLLPNWCESRLLQSFRTGVSGNRSRPGHIHQRPFREIFQAQMMPHGQLFRIPRRERDYRSVNSTNCRVLFGVRFLARQRYRQITTLPPTGYGIGPGLASHPPSAHLRCDIPHIQSEDRRNAPVQAHLRPG